LRKRTPAFALASLAVFASAALGIVIVDQGTIAKEDTITCGGLQGRVVVRTGVTFRVPVQKPGEKLLGDRTFSNGISIAFIASRSAEIATAVDCCWVQFIWIEGTATVESTGISRRKVRLTPSQPIPMSGGDMTMSGDPTKPGWTPPWHLDSGAGSPCYEEGGGAVTDSRGTTMYDRPDNLAELLGPSVVASNPKLKVVEVEAKEHFDAYLQCGHHPCYVVHWQVSFTWTPQAAGAAVTGPTYDPAPSGQAVSALDPLEQAALDRDRPGQNVLPK
jgi:hypothetical protein